MVDDDTTTATAKTMYSAAGCASSILPALPDDTVLLQPAERMLGPLRDTPLTSRIRGWRMQSASVFKANWRRQKRKVPSAYA